MEVQIQGNKINCPLKDKWLIATPEELIRQRYICRLANEYQYQLEQMGQEITVANGHRGQGKARADIVIWRSVEDKRAEKVHWSSWSARPKQLLFKKKIIIKDITMQHGPEPIFSVTTNQKETRIFRVVKGHMPKRLEEIVDIPKATDAGKKIRELLNQTKAFTRDEFSKLLFTCHNIIRNNDKLISGGCIRWNQQDSIHKIRYERNNNDAQIFSKEKFKSLKKEFEAIQSRGSQPVYQMLFDKTKEDFAKDDLFEPNDTIKIKEASFEAIVEKLQIYNLSNTADDVKGIAFEKFLGKTFRETRAILHASYVDHFTSI